MHLRYSSAGYFSPFFNLLVYGSAPRFVPFHQEGTSEGSETAFGVIPSWTRGALVAWIKRSKIFPGPDGIDSPKVSRIPKDNPTPFVVDSSS